MTQGKAQMINHIPPTINETIDGHSYQLQPGINADLSYYYQQQQGYDELERLSQQQFVRYHQIQDTQLNQQHHCLLTPVIPADLCSALANEASKSPEAIYHPQFMERLLPMILSGQVDQHLISYFASEYALLSYVYLDDQKKPADAADSHHWQCRKGPAKQLLLQIYLTDQDQASHSLLSKTSSDILKDYGYLFTDSQQNSSDITPLFDAQNRAADIIHYRDIHKGAGILFNPNQLAAQANHQAENTGQGSKILQLCFIASPYTWQMTKANALFTQTKAVEFDGYAQQLIDHSKRQASDINPWVLWPKSGKIESPEQLKLLLDNMYADPSFAQLMFTRIMAADPNHQQVATIDDLLETLKLSFKASINWDGELGQDNIRNLSSLATFELEYKDSLNRYDPATKPAKAVGLYWPIPNHPTHPGNKYQSKPYVKKQPIMDANTPIGSAGSCFAQEIAKVFQETQFNYVITERNDDPGSGLIVDNYTPGDKYAISSANYGIIFNTPSFRQLAERAFAIQPTQKLLFQQADGSWFDPYRENVLFISHEAWANDYESHLRATRDALAQSEVFIITLGLNECWQFRDGSVMSRMPRANSYPLVTHKVLTVQENVANIQRFYDIVKAHNPKLKLIISVSPVPFMATGRADEYHVIAANCHSKSVLRVAADELVKNNADMYYLPSYEMVTECIEDPWAADHRHVKKSTVNQVVEMFGDIFIKP